MLQKKEWLSKLARGNQHVLLTESAAVTEDCFLQGAGDSWDEGNSQKQARKKNISTGSTHADLLSFLFFAKQCFLSFRSKTMQNI